MLLHFATGSHRKHSVSRYQISLYYSKDHWKCETNIVSIHQLQIKAPSLTEYFSFPNPQSEPAALFSYSCSVLQSVANLINNPSILRVTLYSNFLSFWLATSDIIVYIFSPFLEPFIPFKNTSFLHSMFTLSHFLLRQLFTCTFTNLHSKLDVNPLLWILSIFHLQYNIDTKNLLNSLAINNSS